MTDQTPVSVISAPRHTVDFVHELFWEQIRRLFADELQRSQARMGTVSGVTGTSLLVLPDGSAVPRALPHVAGRRFAIGQRVIIAPVQGLPVVVGGVLTAAGSAEAVISSVDIADGAIGAGHIATGAITTRHIAPGAIGAGQIAPNAVTLGTIAPGAVSTAQIVDGALTTSHFAYRAIGYWQVAVYGLLGAAHTGDSNFYPGTIGPDDIANGSIGESKLIDDAVSARKIQTGAIRGGRNGNMNTNTVAWNNLSAGNNSMQAILYDLCGATGVTCYRGDGWG